jgi:hypothetical protein
MFAWAENKRLKVLLAATWLKISGKQTGSTGTAEIRWHSVYEYDLMKYCAALVPLQLDGRNCGHEHDGCGEGREWDTWRRLRLPSSTRCDLLLIFSPPSASRLAWCRSHSVFTPIPSHGALSFPSLASSYFD